MNALVGERLSIVTAKAQTTWQRVTGLRSEDGVQAVFLDTPGLLSVRDLHQRAMLEAAHEALRDADMVLVLVEASDARRGLDVAAIRTALEEVPAGTPVRALLTKIDTIPGAEVENCARRVREALGVPVRAISSKDGRGIGELWVDIRSTLPESPFFFPEDDLATQPVRFFVEEFVRETVFELYEQEIPWSVIARVEEFRENDEPLYVLVHLYVDRKSQKGIVLGKGGHAIRELGTRARAKIEAFLGRRVYLDLWVKPLPGWRRKRGALSSFGFRIPDDDA
jgi:GTP-binding protein Era